MATNAKSSSLKLSLDGLAQAQAGMMALSNSVIKLGQVVSAIGPAFAALASGEIFGNMVKGAMEFAERTTTLSHKSRPRQKAI